jgi:DMSO reductase anchor subunit
MELSSVALALFTVFSAARIFSYLPQIQKVARDTHGATAISYSTWLLWTGANISTALYAITNLDDMYLAVVNALYAGCCVTVILLTMAKRRSGAVPRTI